MSDNFQVVVCAGISPDPLQRLEPLMGAQGPGLKNEMLLQSVLDPWAASSLFEAVNFAKQNQGTKVYLVSLAPKAKLQQVMMVLAQKAGFELVVLDGPASGFTDSLETAEHLAQAIKQIPGLDLDRLLIFGGWESATRGSGTTMQFIGEILNAKNQFQGVDKITLEADASLQVMERVEGGQHQVSTCSTFPAVFGWATGELPEPPNNPQAGMANMRLIMPALAKAKPMKFEGTTPYKNVELPAQQRSTRVVKDVPLEEMAKEIIDWIKG